MTKEYRVEMKVRNATILRALENLREAPSAFAKRVGVDAGVMCAIVAMTKCPQKADGMWRKEIVALSEATGILPEDFFTPRQIEGFERTRAKYDVAEADWDRRNFFASEKERFLLEAADPGKTAGAKDLADTLLAELRLHNPRDAKAVQLHVLDGITLEEVGKIIGLSRERVRQIMCRGLRFMANRAAANYSTRQFSDVFEGGWT